MSSKNLISEMATLCGELNKIIGELINEHLEMLLTFICNLEMQSFKFSMLDK